jgi:solute carrier family 5 (sodium-coupled monocarboxylate transporter), member 8/12
MSAVVLEDFCKPFMKKEMSTRKTNLIMRGTVLILGIVSVALVYVVQHLGSVLQLSMSVPTACFGPMLGVYIIGFTMPWIGKRATLIGAVTASITMLIIVFEAQAEMATGTLKFEYKPLSVNGCTYDYDRGISNLTSTMENGNETSTEKSIFHISYLYYTFLGSSIVVVVSTILSCIIGFQDTSEVDPRLLAPFLRNYVASKSSNRRFTGTNGRETVIHNFEISKEKSDDANF